MATKKFKCKVCGYVHEGDKTPEKCPVCQAPASEFEEIVEEGAPAKKGMDRNSNAYTIIYSAVMVILVAVGLAVTSQSLRPFQKANEDNDKRLQILRSINVSVTANEAEAKYNELITDAFLINENGEKVGDATDAFVGEKEGFPIFVATVDGQTKYIMALHGSGLWGALWGYLSVDDDKNTVYGAYFTHESETAGLGAEIKDNVAWQEQFQGKKLTLPGRKGIAIEVVKKNEVTNPAVQCDAVTGATLTTDGVSRMLQDCLGKYIKFLNDKNI